MFVLIFIIWAQELLKFVLDHIEDKSVESLVEVTLLFEDSLLTSNFQAFIFLLHQAIKQYMHYSSVILIATLQGLLEARAALRPLLLSSTDRLKDLIFLDIALDSTVRTAVERSYENLNNASPEVN